jgi:hypothetical protein
MLLSMSAGEALTRWTVRVALILYLLGLIGRRLGTPRAARLAWSAGCAAFLVHVVCAFHSYHDWSHAAAEAATARDTAQVVGIDWGGGLYLNYAFALIWLADAAWWWCGLEGYESRPRFVAWSIQAFLAFMFFNATVVFGAGTARWLGGVLSSVLLVLVLDSVFVQRQTRAPDCH